MKLSETPQHALRRLALEQIGRAEKALSLSGDTESAIHETRKCLKRIRALLRLVRPGLGERVFAAHNTRFRDIGRLLSPARDAQILPATLLKLEPLADASEAEVIAALKSLIDAAGEKAHSNTDAVAAALIEFTEAKAAIAKISVSGEGFDPIEEGLRCSYRKGARLLKRAYKCASDETFHDLRKSVQLHWRHMALLTRAWPDLFAARLEAARQLSQILGDSQDLSVLIGYCNALDEDDGSKWQPVAQLAARRQHELRQIAEPRAGQLFCVPPKAFAGAVAACWAAAKKIDALPSDYVPAVSKQAVILQISPNLPEEPDSKPEVQSHARAATLN